MEKYRYSAEARAALEGLQLPLVVYQVIDGEVVTLLVSEGFCRLFGYADREQAAFAMDHNMYRNIHPDDMVRIRDAARRYAEGGDKYDVVFRTASGMDSGYRVIHATGMPVRTETGVRISHVWYMDEGEHVEGSDPSSTGMNRTLNNALHEESILKAAHYDALTGLPNLSWFFKLSEDGKAWLTRNGKQGAVLYMDLNGMKYFNHRNGFAEGDKLLKAFAEVVTRVFGKDNCCHIGADRFAAGTTEDALQGQLQELFRDARKMNCGNTLPVRVGIYKTNLEDVPVSTAYDRAKMACDTLRKSDVSAFNYYDKRLRDADRRHQYLVGNIDKAVAEKWIQVYFQPIIRAVSEKVCDEEALARWIDPVEGFLSPAEFIPQLERSGLIYKLDLYMLDQVLEKIRVQEKAGLELVPQSINLSRSDFDACDIVEEFRKRVDAAGIPRSLITIEITESVIGSDFEFMKEQVARFRALGFPVWMDDFGSGYSSLDVLQSIRFDLIKLDMSFMRKLDEGEGGRIILTDLMRMATSLGVDTVCEGVETEAQFRFLQEIGCSKLQGYYFGKPCPFEEILEKYRTGQQRFGFEQAETAAYFETIGRVNLYDLDMIAAMDTDSFLHSFNTVPMAILEIRENTARYVRTNPSYREFMQRFFGFDLSKTEKEFKHYSAAFMDHMIRTCRQGGRAFYNEKMPDGSVVHTFARRVSVNPSTGDMAVAVAVLSISELDEEGIENAIRERNALARVMAITGDYLSLYSIEPESGRYVEYTASADYEKLGFEKEGADFFVQGVVDGKRTVCPEDLPGYLDGFTREKVLKAVREAGRFVLNYRLVIEGKPVPVSLRITSFQDGVNEKLLAGVRKWQVRN